MAPPKNYVYPPHHAIFRMKWATLSCLSVLTGERSSGSILALADPAAGAGPFYVPANTYLVPRIVSGTGSSSTEFDRMTKTGAEASVDPVTSPSGTAIPILSAQGGVRQNLPAGTVLEWYPEPPVGLLPTVVCAGGTTGGTNDTSQTGLARVVTLEGLGTGATAAQIWKAGAGQFPAAVVAWEGSDEGRVLGTGAGQVLKRHQLKVFVIVTRLDGNQRRQDQGELLLSAIEAELSYRAEVDGEIFSSPPTHPGALGRLALDPASLVYTYSFGINHVTSTSERRAFAQWLKLRTRIQTTDDGIIQPPADPIVVVDDTRDMP